MDSFLRKFRDRLRIIIILYVFCEQFESANDRNEKFYGLFRSEIKIQALDFLLRYPDFLSMELMNLMDDDTNIDRNDIRNVITKIYSDNEPDLRVENKLSELKTELAAIDRKIQLSIASEPKEQEEAIKISDIKESFSVGLKAM